MIVTSYQIRETISGNRCTLYTIFKAIRSAGVQVEQKTTRSERGHFLPVNHFDIDAAIKAMEIRIKTHPQKERYIKHWQKTLDNLNKIREELR